MAPVGHYKLGAYGSTARDYMQEGGAATIRRYRVNSQSTKFGQGIKKYENEEFWDYWTMTDWKAGIGQTKTDAGGSLYSTVSTIVPNQIILPPVIDFTNIFSRADSDPTYAHEPGYFVPSQTSTSYAWQEVSSTGTYKKVGIFLQFIVPATTHYYIDDIWLLARVPKSTVLNASIFTTTTGGGQNVPNAQEVTGSITGDQTDKSFHWHKIDLGTTWDYNNTTGSPVTITRFIVVWPTSGAIDLYYGADDNTKNATSADGSAWVGGNETFNFFYITNLSTYSAPGDTTGPQVRAIKASPTYGALSVVLDPSANPDQIYVYNYDSTNSQWDSLNVGGNTYWTEDVSTTNAWQIPRSGPVVVPLSSTHYGYLGTYSEVAAGADAFLFWNGYYYRGLANNIYYDTSVTSSTWANGPFAVGSSSAQITALVGAGDNVYAITNEGMAWLAPGDFVKQVAVWEDGDTDNGKGAVEHNGSIYIPVNGQLYQYSASGGLMNIWINREDLPTSRFGTIKAMVSTNHFLYVLVEGSVVAGPYSVWAWDGAGWHFVMEPAGATVFHCMCYDRLNGRLWVGGNGPAWCSVAIPDAAINPYNDTSSRFMPDGWIEFPWFDGAVMSSSKDFESVTIVCEEDPVNTQHLSYGRVLVYWKDDASTDWEYLGVVNGIGTTTLRWSSYLTRPNTERLKLGLKLDTNYIGGTPRIQAVVVRFLTNVTDRYGWQLRIQVADDTIFLNGEEQTYTVAQQCSHLDALEVQTPPFPFTDNMEGVTYEVRLMQASRDILAHEYNGSTHTTKYVYNWQLEETT